MGGMAKFRFALTEKKLTVEKWTYFAEKVRFRLFTLRETYDIKQKDKKKVGGNTVYHIFKTTADPVVTMPLRS